MYLFVQQVEVILEPGRDCARAVLEGFDVHHMTICSMWPGSPCSFFHSFVFWSHLPSTTSIHSPPPSGGFLLFPFPLLAHCTFLKISPWSRFSYPFSMMLSRTKSTFVLLQAEVELFISIHRILSGVIHSSFLCLGFTQLAVDGRTLHLSKQCNVRMATEVHRVDKNGEMLRSALLCRPQSGTHSLLCTPPVTTSRAPPQVPDR